MKKPRSRRHLSPEEEALWQAVMKDVTPLPGKMHKPEPLLTPTVTPVVATPPPRMKPLRLAVPIAAKAPPVTMSATAPESAYQMNRGWDRKLRRGAVDIDDRIDLHGLTREQAFTVLHRFLLNAIHMQKRCLLVITGKGRRGADRDDASSSKSQSSESRGILKSEVPRWLYHGPLGPQILSIQAAHIKDGGGGAYYVILRRQRQDMSPWGRS